MKVVLFCGGLGMRLREYSERIPKPLAEIGSRPLLWHLMKYYAHFGHKDFILALGYGGSAIKRYFLDYDETVSNDFVISEGGKNVELKSTDIGDWRITCVDTGLSSNIGERLRTVRRYLVGEEMFLANYGDGLSDLPLDHYVQSFQKSEDIASFLSVKVPQSFHLVHADADNHALKLEAINTSSIRINGGFFVFRREIFDYMRAGEELVVEPFARLIERHKLLAYPYDGFWHSMDTFKDKIQLDDMVARRERAPWQVWRPEVPSSRF
jgi:glucose-1-phosphate cytidylyltransferase